jgi:hypothetical protein
MTEGSNESLRFFVFYKVCKSDFFEYFFECKNNSIVYS